MKKLFNPQNLLKAALVAGGVLLGTGGTITAQKASTEVKPQVIQLKPDCPAIYIDHVRKK